MLALGYIGMGAGYVVLIGHGSITAFAISMVIFTVGEMFAFSRQQAYAASLAPDDMRGRYVGFLSLAWGIGGIFASIVGLHINEHSPDTVWIVSAVLGLVAAVLILGGGRAQRSNEEPHG